MEYLDFFSALHSYPKKGNSLPVTPTRRPLSYKANLPEAIAALLPALQAGHALLHDNSHGISAHAQTPKTQAHVCCRYVISRAKGCESLLLVHQDQLRLLLRVPADALSQQLSCSFLSLCLFPQEILVSRYHLNRCKFTFQLLPVYLCSGNGSPSLLCLCPPGLDTGRRVFLV